MKASILSLLGVVLAFLLCVAAFSGTANAASGDYFKSTAALSWCAQENGSDRGVFLDPCSPTSGSDLWVTTVPQAGYIEIKNVHSGLCMTGESSGTVDLTACSANNQSQWWGVGTCNNNLGFIYFNQGQSGWLWQSVKSLQTRSTLDPNSSHDCWAFYTP